jgi:hypothetical protein
MFGGSLLLLGVGETSLLYIFTQSSDAMLEPAAAPRETGSRGGKQLEGTTLCRQMVHGLNEVMKDNCLMRELETMCQ